MPAAGLTGFAALLWNVSVSIVIGKLAQGFQGKPKNKYIPQNREVTVRGTVEPRQLIYGEVQTGGFLAYQNTGGPNKRYLYVVLVVAGHQCEAFTEFRVDNTRIRLSDFGFDWAFSNNIVHPRFMHDADPNPAVDPYSRLSIYSSLGDSDGEPAVTSFIGEHLPEWDATHIGRGLAYWVARLEFDETVWPNGAPDDFYAVVKGRKVYDPRLDSTNGGSGSHRVNDATTWAWSDNSTLCTRDYVSGGSITYDIVAPNKLLTVGEDDSRINDATVITAANIDDESVTVPIPVLQGVVTFTNGSDIVTGVETAFTYQLDDGRFVYGADGNFYEVDSVDSDTQITLTSNYAGATADLVTAQYHTSAVTTTTQKRYTCNAQISLGDRHKENLEILLSSNIGHLLWSKNKYIFFSGAYVAPAVHIGEAECHGRVDLNTHPFGEDNYNVVSGTFYDENRGWTKQDFPPQTDASYQADDGSVDTRTIDLPATRDIFRAQRIANAHLQQGRNKEVFQFTDCCGEALDLLPNETFTTTLPEMGVSGSAYCVEEMTWKRDGYVDITARITSSASWADMDVADYQIPRNKISGPSATNTPETPTSLVATPKDGYIHFDWNQTLTMRDAFVEIWEYTASTPFSSATLIATSFGTSYDLPRSTLDKKYYWITRVANGQRSTNYPATTGVEGYPLSINLVVNFVARTSCVYGGGVAYKTTGSDTYDSDVYSSIAFTGGAYCEYTVPALCNVFVGLNTSPSAAQSDTTIDYAFAHGGAAGLTVTENGSSSGTISGAYVAGDHFRIEYDNAYVRYYKNGNLERQVAAASGQTLAFDSSFRLNARIENIKFGPFGASLPPVPPNALNINSFAGGYTASWTTASAQVEGAKYQLYRHTASTPFSSAALVWEGEASSISIQTDDLSTGYFWIRAVVNAQTSSTHPSSAGSGEPGAALPQIPFIARGQCIATHDTIEKRGGSAAYDSDCYSRRAYSVFHLAFKASQATADLAIGVSTSPISAQTVANMDYCINLYGDGHYDFKKAGSAESIASTGYNTSTEFLLTYDGSDVRFYKNRIQLFTEALASATLYFDSSFNTPGGAVNSIKWGPGTIPGLVDTSQLGGNSATAVTSASDDSVSLINGGGVILSASLSALGISYLLQVTATFDIWITDDGGGTPEFYLEVYGNSTQLGTSLSAFPVVAASPGERLTMICEVPIDPADEVSLQAQLVWTGAQPSGTAEARNVQLRCERIKR